MSEQLSLSESKRLLARHNSIHGRRYWKALALLALAVLAGVVIGAGGTILFFKKKMHWVPPRPDAIAEAMMQRMESLVEVNPHEGEQLRGIIDSHMREVEGIRKGSFQEIRGVCKRMDAEVSKVLGPERGKIWDEAKAARAAERRRRHEGYAKSHSGEAGPKAQTATPEK